ncbi:MAG: DUF1501 domain-containing protein [Bacteroidota bacterium]
MCDNHNTPNNLKNTSKKRHGSSLKDGKAHQKDHLNWSRRNFLRQMGVAGSMSMMLGSFPVMASSYSPLASALSNAPGDRVLILIRLKGGNDGLNTIVPMYSYDHYKFLRPTIGFERNEIRMLDDKFGMPKYMDDLYPLWQEGKMKVINSVGYDQQNLSHFRSSDIWSSASDPDVFDASGWMGRYIVNEFPDFDISSPPEPPAIQIGSVGSNLFNNQDIINMAMVVSNPEELAELAQNGELYDTLNMPDCYFGEQLRFLRSTTNNTFKYADVIAEAYKASTNDVAYEGRMGSQLALIARMIKGGLSTKVYMVSLDGFDTHADQPDAHRNLMSDISKAVKDLYDDLSIAGRDKDVLCMTFSEFGRRIEQNDSAGTDHGAAAPVLLFGEGLGDNGFYGDNPNLNNTDRAGNLVHNVDFREIYATVLNHWLCVDDIAVDGIMGQSFNRLDFGLSCVTTSTTRPPFVAMKHELRYQHAGQATIHYQLPRDARVNITVFDMLGRPVETLVNGRQVGGPHQVVFNSRDHRIMNGVYVYRIQADGQRVSGQMRMMN